MSSRTLRSAARSATPVAVKRTNRKLTFVDSAPAPAPAPARRLLCTDSSTVVWFNNKGVKALLELRRGDVTWPAFPSSHPQRTWATEVEWRAATDAAPARTPVKEKEKGLLRTDSSTVVWFNNKGVKALLELRRGDVTWPSFPSSHPQRTWATEAEWRAATEPPSTPTLTPEPPSTPMPAPTPDSTPTLALVPEPPSTPTLALVPEPPSNPTPTPGSQAETTCVTKCRDMAKCFTHGQRIRHKIGKHNTWTGMYDSSTNRIVYYRQLLTLNQFSESHYKSERPDRCSSNNAWKECECEADGVWISTFNLPAPTPMPAPTPTPTPTLVPEPPSTPTLALVPEPQSMPAPTPTPTLALVPEPQSMPDSTPTHAPTPDSTPAPSLSVSSWQVKYGNHTWFFDNRYELEEFVTTRAFEISSRTTEK